EREYRRSAAPRPPRRARDRVRQPVRRARHRCASHGRRSVGSARVRRPRARATRCGGVGAGGRGFGCGGDPAHQLGSRRHAIGARCGAVARGGGSRTRARGRLRRHRRAGSRPRGVSRGRGRRTRSVGVPRRRRHRRRHQSGSLPARAPGAAMIVPSVDLMQGRAVQLRRGRDFVLDGGDPMARLEQWAVAGEVAVVDLDAALGEGSNAGLIREMVRRAPCGDGGGIRDLDTARAWLDAGATRIVVGTAASPDFCGALPRDRVIAAVDADRGQVVVEGWRTATGASVLDRIRTLAPVAGGFLFTQVENEGAMGGFDFQAVAAAVRAAGDARVTAAGGITTATEIAELDRIGADALVRVDLDCDRDALRFTVRQRGAGFCHLERRSCWPSGFDLDDLARTISERAARPEPGSGTAKLLADPGLLAAKLREEAEELGRARERAEVVHETADVLYLALVAVVRGGGTLADVVAELSRRRGAVTRRPMVAKSETTR